MFANNAPLRSLTAYCSIQVVLLGTLTDERSDAAGDSLDIKRNFAFYFVKPLSAGGLMCLGSHCNFSTKVKVIGFPTKNVAVSDYAT